MSKVYIRWLRIEIKLELNQLKERKLISNLVNFVLISQFQIILRSNHS